MAVVEDKFATTVDCCRCSVNICLDGNIEINCVRLFLTFFRHCTKLYPLNVVYSGYIGFAGVDNRRPAKVLIITFNAIYVKSTFPQRIINRK